MRPVKRRQAVMHVRGDGSCPFEIWLGTIADVKVSVRLDRLVTRLERGNLGDWRALGSGVLEGRVHFGSGWRVYFGIKDDEVILLCGGPKRTQVLDIEKAKELWREHERRPKQKKWHSLARWIP